jgi:hypothetical protein
VSSDRSGSTPRYHARVRGWLLSALALWAGCQFDGGLGTGLLCPTGECPAGQVCRDGVCTTSGGQTPDASAQDAGERADSAPSDGGGGGNLIENPGMENGTASWTAYNGVHTTAGEPHGGERSLLVCADTTPDFTVYQDILGPSDQVPQGAVYSARVWVRGELGVPQPGTVMLSIRERGGEKLLLDHSSIDVPLADTEWIELEVTATVQEPDRTNVIFIVWGLSATPGDCFAIDDAVMVAQ